MAGFRGSLLVNLIITQACYPERARGAKILGYGIRSLRLGENLRRSAPNFYNAKNPYYFLGFIVIEIIAENLSCIKGEPGINSDEDLMVKLRNSDIQERGCSRRTLHTA